MRHLLRRLAAALCVCALLFTSAAALTVEEAIQLLEQYYVDELPAEVYEADTVERVFSLLGDPYSYYMTAADYAAFTDSVESTTSVTGVGIQVLYKEEGLAITQVVNGGPAEAAGLVSGDVIVAVDSVSCAPATELSADLVRGEPGTEVTLTVLRRDGSLAEFTLTRALVQIANTNISLMDGGAGLIDCDSFGSETANLIRAGIEAHEEEVDLWLMDLRDNSGGIASVAVEALGLFAGEGIHLYYRDSAGQYYISMVTEPFLTDHPVIVLTNGYSASASELFAAGVRDCGAGISLGGRTYGKGVAQIILDADDADFFTDDAVKITAYRIYSTAGVTTDTMGVIPTLLVDDALTDGVAALLDRTVPEDSQGWLQLILCGWDFYVDLSLAQSEEYAAAFDELLEALPPDAAVRVGAGGGEWSPISSANALTLFGSAAQSRWFTDLENSEYAAQLNTLATYGILKGEGDGTFLPEGEFTRAELCALLAQALGVTSTSPSVFTDVSADSWYADEVMAMVELGLAQGYGGGLFGPEDTVTNEQFMAITAKLGTFLSATLYNTAVSLTGEDLAAESLAGFSPWAREGACLLLGLEELAPVFYAPVAEVDPAAPILRDEAGATLYALLSATGILYY